MPVELVVPPMGESISEVQIGAWRKQPGEPIARDESIVELESDKATIDLPAPSAGTISKILKKEGERAAVGEVIGYMETSPDVPKGTADTADKKAKAPGPAQANVEVTDSKIGEKKPPAPVISKALEGPARIMPSARRVMAEQKLTPSDVTGSGPGGRILKEDVEQADNKALTSPAPAPTPGAAPIAKETPRPTPTAVHGQRDEELVPMTPMRKRIAERLVEAQRMGALLTTFNEVDMSAVIALREQHKAEFQERYGVKLGFMSFFVKAAVEALKQFPKVNAEIRHTDILYHHYYDIGIAVGSGKGLVVPVIRNAELLGFADIEQRIGDFGARAKQNKITLEELEGGTFTISNGGVYGSMMSTPIVNPPQSGILGLHAIQDRPVARDGQVVIRPMMYIALTYDHRIVDGREAVTFLKTVKEYIEQPMRMLLDL
ncbi:MAG: 2-oxoglutarate dehydrogenase complex dihydrolipoyllysine-residue succinyltransferase [Candidatus Hydrogenedentes bacterium]|nr:2-oxoglutarate dehydrogenase complex dihydrolipoyllysine-residue succinyltransferase [Candidatus Hydrogenedentota bacterium]